MTAFSVGDDAAFARVFELAHPATVRAIVCATKNQALAEDVAQETFVKVWHARESYIAGARVLPWIRTIARRTLIDVMRRAQIERETARRAHVSSDDRHDARFEDVIDAKRTAAATFDALDHLPEKQAQAIHVVATEGLTLVGLAKRLGDTPLAVRLRVHRARAALRRVLHASHAGATAGVCSCC